MSLSLPAKKSCGIGRVAGPRFTFPSTSNSLPWHGHSKSPRAGFHRCRHPRCVQRSSNAITCLSPARLTSQQPASGTCIGTLGRSLSRTSLGISRRPFFPILKKANLPIPHAPSRATDAGRKTKRDCRKNRLVVEIGSSKAVPFGRIGELADRLRANLYSSRTEPAGKVNSLQQGAEQASSRTQPSSRFQPPLWS